jgi:hypothetical protein
MTWDLSVDDFLILIRPQLEQQVDEFIAAQPITERPAMIRQRGSLLGQLITATQIANLEYRLRETEARLRPRLVE